MRAVLRKLRQLPTPTLVLGAAGLLMLAALWLFRTSPAAEAGRQAAAAQTDAPAGAPPPRITVDAFTVAASDARQVVEVSGLLEPVREVVIGAEVAGRVVAVEAEEHSSVEEGQVLVRLDQALPGAAVERTRASLLRAEASAKLASAELKRQRDLRRRGVASVAELERAESEAQGSAAQVAEARANLHDAETRLEKTRITAPFAGVVSHLDLEPGAYVAPGTKVAELVDLSQIEIDVGVSDQQILALHEGDPVEVVVDVLPGERFQGSIVRLGRSADPLTRKYAVPVHVPNPEGRLLAGMQGRVRFELGEGRRALRVPRRALVREFDLEYIYVLESSPETEGVATARRRRVVALPLAFRPDLVEVQEGLEGGERVAISGVRELREGLRVRVREGRAGGFDS